MAIWDYVMRAFRETKLPCEEDMAFLRRYYDSEYSKPRLKQAEKWARRLYSTANFEEIASGMTFDYHRKDPEAWNVYKDLARRILKSAGANAVPGILAAFEKRPSEQIAEMLASINDPRAVPAIKHFLDRGGASASTLKYTLEGFLERHRTIAAQVDTAHEKCCLCGKSRPITHMREYVGAGYFCTDTCWRKRAQKIKHGSGDGCPYFVGGMCEAGGGDNVCSLETNPFTSCYVYKLHPR